jgi:predicted amidophosphoribosyltransferase
VPTAEELTDPHLTEYVPTTPAGPGICRDCHGSSGRYPRCFSCNESRKGVTPAGLIVPVSLTRTDQTAQLYNVLKDYKGARDEQTRATHRLHVAALLVRFLDGHGACIENTAGRPFDVITIVPSKRGRVGPHPLEVAIGYSETLTRLYVPMLEPGPGQIERSKSAPDGFVAKPEANGARVLLVDDTMTTAAHVHSAAHALTEGGADVVGAVLLGRVIDVSDPKPDTPEHIAEMIRQRQELWARQSAIPFDFGVCCLE